MDKQQAFWQFPTRSLARKQHAHPLTIDCQPGMHRVAVVGVCVCNWRFGRHRSNARTLERAQRKLLRFRKHGFRWR